jgi:hypothetical protein
VRPAADRSRDPAPANGQPRLDRNKSVGAAGASLCARRWTTSGCFAAMRRGSAARP